MPVAIFGSTVEGEDERLLATYTNLVEAGYFVIIAPRKPERFEIVAGLLMGSQIRFARRSEWSQRPQHPHMLLLDTIGELARMYRLGTTAFVGGSLVPGTGGHNPIEPAAAGVPVTFGPYMSNFREIAATFLASGAARECADATEVEAFMLAMLRDQEARRNLGRIAVETVEKNRGAAERTAAVVIQTLREASPAS
jgi:3-deoxy-D-manno-octulosonic-acid transferase